MTDLIPARPPAGRIAFATIQALTLHATMSPRERLEASLVVGTKIERYNRAWRMGPWHYEGEMIVGRIGFESAGINELWDDEAQDFKEATRPLGLTSPFAIEPTTLRIAFQVRGRDIKVASFTGALEALLNAASETDRWRVHRELKHMSFEQWSSTAVDAVTLIRATLERPNPHYGDRRQIREMVEGTKARLVEVVLRGDPSDPQGLDVRANLVREAIDHVSENYGSLTAFGQRAGDEQQWSSQGDGSVAEVRRVPADPTTRDVSGNALRHELGDPTAQQELLEEALAAIDQIGRDVDEIDLFADDTAEGL